MGGNGNLGGIAKRFVSSLLRAVPTSLTMFRGGTWEGGSCEEKDADFAGKPGSPLNGAWRWKGGRMIRSDIILCARHPRVRRCCQSAGIHCTKGCRRHGRRKSQILGEPEKLSSLNETKSLSSIFGCEEKTEISSPSRIN